MGMSRAYGFSKKQAASSTGLGRPARSAPRKPRIDAMYRIAEDGFDEGLETIQKRILGGSIASACQNLFAGLTAVAQRDLDTFAKYAAAA